MSKHYLKVLIVFSLLNLCGIAQANPLIYIANLDGLSEAPPNASPGTGLGTVTIDTVAHTLRVEVSFSDLLAGNTAAHIHAATSSPLTGTASVATQTPTFIGFPSGATSGTYDQIFDMTLASSFRAGFITSNGGTEASAEAALAAALEEGKAYLNIHSTLFPGGEIRGFLTPIPDNGSTAPMLISALLVLLGLARSRNAAVI